MKRLLSIAACLLVCGIAMAQNTDGTRMSIRLGVGFPGSGPEKFVSGLSQGAYGLEGLYSDYYSDTKATPAITAECLFRVNEWFEVGAELGYSSYSNQRFNGITDKEVAERNGQSFVVLPTAHVSYFQKDALTLYLGIGVGAGYYPGFDNMAEKVAFEMEFVPFGVEFGKRVYGFAEFCLGTAINWLHGGIGYRF